MKKILIAVMAFCCILAFSCKKDNNQPHELFIGATVQNTDWTAQPTTTYFAGKDSLQIEGYRATGEQALTFKLGFHGVGTYTLTGNEANYFTTLGGDAVTSTYNLDATQTNTVTITSFNVVTGIATGSFELHLVKTYGAASLNNTISFTNGKFWIETPAAN